ncbi:MAG: hypothetical protein CBB97_07100 [Candidatus Endolissoclinum sp. TMED37]|nr:MAG: hypothetical protein CBB97_07100 [Candidatus Endolissoclinum sp. TMED37]
MSDKENKNKLNESGDVMLSGFKEILAPWKDFGSILKGELKRTVINLNTFLTLTLGPTLAGADYAEFMRKTKAKTDKIDADVEKALDRLPVGTGVRAIALAVAPGPVLFGIMRDTAGKVTPEVVGNFMDEYGFTNLKIGRIPVGKAMKKIAQAGATAGSFATLQMDQVGRQQDELEQDAEPKWYTPIERLLLLQSPLGPSFRNESAQVRRNILTEANEDEVEKQAFLNVLRLSGFEQQYMNKVAIPYVDAKDKMITGLVDIFEKDIVETSAIATAPSFEEFLKAIDAATLEKFKPLNSKKIEADMKKEIDGLVEDEETLSKFLKAVDKKLEDFQDDEKKLKQFLMQKLYEKEFTKVRMASVESILDSVEELKGEILGDMKKEDIKELKGHPMGEQMFTIIDSAIKRLDASVSKITDAKSRAEKV